MKTVNLYDFDGVLASPFEEALFTLPDTESDAEFIRSVSHTLSLDLSSESPRGQRYMALQSVLWHNRHGINPGPVSPEKGVPFYIITARCDLYATRRMHEFVSERLGSRPLKTMHVDHLVKGIMLDMLLERHPDVNFKFWDDNPRHIESARALNSDRLEIFHVDNDMGSVYPEAESFYRNLVSQWI